MYECCDSQFEEPLKISWDNKYVVVATASLTYDKILTIDLTSGAVVSYYTSVYTGNFDSISIASDSKSFAASHSSGRIFVFNMTVSTPFQTITNPDGSSSNIFLSGNGKYLAFVTQNNGGKLYFYDVENNDQLWFNDNNYHRYDRAGPKTSINGKDITVGGSGKAHCKRFRVNIHWQS